MKKIAIFFVLAVMTASIFAGCGQKSDSGTVSTDGSTSMEKVIGALGEAFEQEYDSVTLHITQQVPAQAYKLFPREDVTSVFPPEI